MKHFIAAMLFVAIASLTGCSGKGAQELYETAQFEEKQHNRPHAMSLYEEIVSKYPQTDYAARARERLADLKKGK